MAKAKGFTAVYGNLLESREKLEHTNRFLKTVFDATQAGLMVVLRDGGILMANKTAKELLEDESLPGNNISAYIEDEALLLCQERLLASGNGDLCPGHEATLASKTGRRIEVLCGHKPITHPSVFEPCVLLSFQDISSIKASLRYLERLLALLPVAYKLDDPETGLILEANKAFLEMFGYSPEELKSKTWMDLTPPRYLEQGLELAKTSLETGGIVWEDKAYLAKGGREVAIRHGYTHIYHPGLGKIVALTLTLPKEGPLSLPQEFKRLERCSDRNAGKNQPEHVVFLKNKIHTVSGTQAESVPNFLWNGNLPLARERRFHSARRWFRS